MVDMPETNTDFSYDNRGSYKINFRTKIRGPDSTSGQDYFGDKRLLVGNRQITYQVKATLLGNHEVLIKTCTTLNPPSPMPTGKEKLADQ